MEKENVIAILGIVVIIIIVCSFLVGFYYWDKRINDFCLSKSLKHRFDSSACYEIKGDDIVYFEVEYTNDGFKFLEHKGRQE